MTRRTIPTIWIVTAVFLVALNLRPAVVAIGPVANDLADQAGLNAFAIGLLTTLPLVCFGALAPVGPPLARRFGVERATMIALVLVGSGIAIRLLPSTVALFAGSLVVGAGIALGNVLLPAVVKSRVPKHTALVMAVYSVALNGGVVLAAALTVPIRDSLGGDWRVALGSWGVLALIALSAWLPLTTTRTKNTDDQEARYRVWRSRLGWSAAGFIGLQSLVFYALNAWIPTLLQDAGMSDTEAGLMLGLSALLGIPGGLIMPLAATRLRQQRMLTALVSGAFLIGMLGLLWEPVSLAVLWMILIGLAQGAGISLALTLFVLRTRTPEGTTQISAMAQCAGYLIAAIGPFTAGALYELTNGWTIPLLFLIITLAPLVWAGWIIGGARILEDEHKPSRPMEPLRP